MKFKTICCYCQKTISIKEYPDEQQVSSLHKSNKILVSHGICDFCLPGVKAEYGLNQEGDE